MDNGTQGPSENGHSAATLSPKAAKMEAKGRKSSPSGKHS
jgi:hypothetical protein